MNLQYSIIFLAILNVVCCYPSSGEDDSHLGTISNSSESTNPPVSMALSYLDGSQVDKDDFPEVEYPTKILDTIEPFYYRAADHNDTLAPFTSDVKDSFRSIEAERKFQEHSGRQDYVSTQDMNIQQIVEEDVDPRVNEPMSCNVTNTSDVSVCEGSLQAASEEEIETSDDNCQLNVVNRNIEPTSTPTDCTETSVTTQDDSLEHSDEKVYLDYENKENVDS